MGRLPTLLTVLLTAGALAGCGGGRTAADDPLVVDAEIVEGVAGEVSVSGLGADPEGIGQSNDDDPLARRVIYFDFDSSLLTAEGQAVAQAHAHYLSGVSNVRVILEGHTDERGTREYNLALAEDRAKAVANLMQALGIDASRIQTVSYGEERPVALGHDESAWTLNRRVEILYQ